MPPAADPIARPALLKRQLLALLFCLPPSTMWSPAASSQGQRPERDAGISYAVSTADFSSPERGFYQQVDAAAVS